MNTITRRRLTCRPWQLRTVRRAAVVPVSLPALVQRHAASLAETGANDSRHFPRIEAALYVADPRTGKGVHLCDREQTTLFAALNAARDNGDLAAAHLAARLDAL